MNGFDLDEVAAYRICGIPRDLAEVYQATEAYAKRPWPWYLYGKEIFDGVGAEFRTVDGQEEMLLRDVVYSVQEYKPTFITALRDIGPMGMKKLTDEIGELPEDRDDAIWVGRDIHIATMLGMCLVRCHQIEDYISKSFILAVSDKQKRKYQTIRDLQIGWRKKTLGNMIICVKEAWEIDVTLDAGVEMFREMRNLLIHGITTHERYDISTEWGKKELIQFIRLFDIGSRVVRLAFRSSYAFSLAYAIEHFGLQDDFSDFSLSVDHEEETSMFPEFFKLKTEDALTDVTP
jgi:hypothetical protein